MSQITFEDYPKWAAENIGFDTEDEQILKRYTSNARLIKTFVEPSEVWDKFLEFCRSISAEYKDSMGYELFSSQNFIPELKIKPFLSCVEKSYRINILNNGNFPSPPSRRSSTDEWVVEDNLYRTINDIIRGRMICRYMDGPEFFCRKIAEALSGITVVDFHSMETDLGYYSWHLGMSFDVEILKATGSVSQEKIRVEVQVSTQLQDVMNDLTHSFYEDKRVTTEAKSLWKWRPGQPKFQGVYFGHTLHMIEGMLVELKNRIEADRNDKDGK